MNYTYQTIIYLSRGKDYAHNGINTRFGPTIVHISITLIIINSARNYFFKCVNQEFASRGTIFHIQNMVKALRISFAPQDIQWRLNDFWITYTNELQINQFYSDLTLTNNFGTELLRKTIFINEPFNYKSISLHQVSWNIIGLKIRQFDDTKKQLTLHKFVNQNQNIWFGYMLTKNPFIKFNSFLILVNI